MASSEVPGRTLATGFGVGALIVFALIAGLALAFDVSTVIAVAVGIFVGVFVGGGLGLLVEARVATATTDPAPGRAAARHLTTRDAPVAAARP